MTKISPNIAILLAGVVMLVSCGNDEDLIRLAGDVKSSSGAGEALYQSAKAADDSGKQKKALKLYDEVADEYPMAPSAAKARFRQAEILEQKGEILDSFEAYQKFITRYQGSGMYSTAMDRQIRMANSAADGGISTSFLGLKSKLSTDKIVEMLGKVRDNAPRSANSAKAQFKIGELYKSKKKSKEAIAAYRKLVKDQPESKEAPEALFLIGVVLMEDADMGNQNQATLDLSSEAFRDYIIQYPNHSKNAEARNFITGLKSRELNRSLQIAQYYDRTDQIESAKVYYRDVLKRSKSGSAHDEAKSRLAELGE